MHSSQFDPLGSVTDWLKARTYRAPQQKDWTPEDNLFVDYHRHAEAAGLAPSERVDRETFRNELHAMSDRGPDHRLAKAEGSSLERWVDCWPRTLRHAQRLAA
ncbi:hypothetical protein [Sphingomonas sp. SRS2]|uniref:hypothetical protein n=1 Tax=Sphingomonas sp. SRS2 TaxID=133190 RepID=UPI000A824D4F|nr:hypothetical protein [Sphingomonas sp. SRS2]